MAPTDYTGTLDILTLHVLEREGCRLHYWQGGSGDRPLVVFLHGGALDHRMFNGQIPAVEKQYDVLVWDARGHGRSQPNSGPTTINQFADDLAAVLDDVGFEKVVLVGHSMGSYVAQAFYRYWPTRVSAFVSIGAANIHLAYEWWFLLFLRFSDFLASIWPYETLKKGVSRNLSQYPEVRAYIKSAMDLLDRESLLLILNAIGCLSMKGIPHQHIRIPFLLTHGEHETFLIRHPAEMWVAHDPNCRYVVIPDAAHNANQDNPVFFDPLLMEFLHANTRL